MTGTKKKNFFCQLGSFCVRKIYILIQSNAFSFLQMLPKLGKFCLFFVFFTLFCWQQKKRSKKIFFSFKTFLYFCESFVELSRVSNSFFFLFLCSLYAESQYPQLMKYMRKFKRMFTSIIGKVAIASEVCRSKLFCWAAGPIL